MPALAALDAAFQRPAPWLAPFIPIAARILSAPSPSVAAALNAARDALVDVTFVDPAELPPGEAYEAFIARTGRVPTRDNLHDLFNGIMWLALPRTKRQLNVLQAAAIARDGVGATRGKLRDALTLFDENAAILAAPPELVDALRNRDWQRLFVERRASWSQARLVLFGHALLEKLMQPRKAITAHVWVVDELHDIALAAAVTAEQFAARRSLPLPVLGVPGWWPENEVLGFYDDATVFRPAR